MLWSRLRLYLSVIGRNVVVSLSGVVIAGTAICMLSLGSSTPDLPPLRPLQEPTWTHTPESATATAPGGDNISGTPITDKDILDAIEENRP